MLEAALSPNLAKGTATIFNMNRHGTTGRQSHPAPLEDSFDHLKSLELGATLMVAITYLRRNGAKETEGDHKPSFPEICWGKSLSEIQEVYLAIVADNRRREEQAVASACPLPFVSHGLRLTGSRIL